MSHRPSTRANVSTNTGVAHAEEEAWAGEAWRAEENGGFGDANRADGEYALMVESSLARTAVRRSFSATEAARPRAPRAQPSRACVGRAPRLVSHSAHCSRKAASWWAAEAHAEVKCSCSSCSSGPLG